MKLFSILLICSSVVRSQNEINEISDLPYIAGSAGESFSFCCKRHSNFVDIDQGINGEALREDVGYCPRQCNGRSSISRREFEAILSRNNTQDPLQLFLTLQDRHRSCKLSNKSCRPIRFISKLFFTMNGPQTIEVIDECSCMEKASKCQRISRNVLYHENTPFQVEIDVGSCQGSCDKVLGCKPIRNQTVAITGPNGSCKTQVAQLRTVPVKEIATVCRLLCRCLIIQGAPDFPNRTVKCQLLQELDIGQCKGKCTHGYSSYHCLLNDPENPTRCLSGLYPSRATCRPVSFYTEIITNALGQEEQFFLTKDCGC